MRAVDEIRTRDIHLGKVVLYQLSYNRMSFIFRRLLLRFGSPCCCGENNTRGFSETPNRGKAGHKSMTTMPSQTLIPYGFYVSYTRYHDVI